jgi:indolepyruvate ferredoxin oxidoreductase beta subunit
MSSPVVNVVLAGLGGQGVIKASDILVEAAFSAGFDVKKAEVHGMSQRGGSVTSDVRFGDKVLSPMVPSGTADYVVVLSEDQVELARTHLGPEGILLDPSLVDPATLPHPRSLNIVLLGILSAALPQIPRECWLTALRANLKEKVHAINEKAFDLGISLASEREGKPLA